MPQQTPAYVILPAGTTIRDGNYESAGSFLLYHPLAALVETVWDENFSVTSVYDLRGREIGTGFIFNYVLSPVDKFAGGKTADEAWLKFKQE